LGRKLFYKYIHVRPNVHTTTIENSRENGLIVLQCSTIICMCHVHALQLDRPVGSTIHTKDPQIIDIT